MGQKVSPHGLRVGIVKDWDSRWYASKKEFGDLLVEDYNVRAFLKKKLFLAGISRIQIERITGNKIKIAIDTARPGMAIGKGGTGIEDLRKEVEKLVGKTVLLDIREVKQPDLDPQLVAENIAAALEKRISFRRAMKQAIGRTIKSGAKGIKVLVSGRLGGAEMARSEKYSEGNVPLHTLRANIAYGFAEADTTFGKIGVKVWIYDREILHPLNSAGFIKEQEEHAEKLNKRGNNNRPKRKPGFDRKDKRPKRADEKGNRNFSKPEDRGNRKPVDASENKAPVDAEKNSPAKEESKKAPAVDAN